MIIPLLILGLSVITLSISMWFLLSSGILFYVGYRLIEVIVKYGPTIVVVIGLILGGILIGLSIR